MIKLTEQRILPAVKGRLALYLLLVILASTLLVTTETRDARADAASISFDTSSISLTSIGASQTVTMSVTGLTPAAAGGQIHLQHSANLTITSPGAFCTGVMSFATVPLGPQIDPGGEGGTLVGCSAIGLESADPATGTFLQVVVTRVAGVGDETITLVGDGLFPSKFSTGIPVTDIPITDLSDTMDVVGFNLPTAPASATAVSTKSMTIDLSWPAASGSPAVTDYIVTNVTSSATTSVSGLSTNIPASADGALQTVTVAARSAAGTGPTATTTVTTNLTVADAPTGSVTSEGDGQITVGWTAAAYSGRRVVGPLPDAIPGLGSLTEDATYIDDFTITATPVGGGTASTTTQGGVTTTLVGLVNGTTYNVTVTTNNATGLSAASATVQATPFGQPGAPTITGATGINQGVALDVTEPASTGGVAIADYFVSIYNASTDALVSTGAAVAVSGVVSHTDLTNIINGTTYYATAAATNVGGNVSAGLTGPASASSTNFIPVGKPGIPQNVSASAGNESVGVAWDEVDVDANGNNLLSAVTHYIVTWTDGTTAASSTIALADLASTAGPPLRYSTVISGLTNGVAYTVTVVARNGDGDSDASTSADATPAATALSDVVLNQSSVKVGSEKNFQFVATPLTADGGTPPNVTLTWMASAGSITQTGNFTAPTGPATVTVSVSATQAGTGATANDSATVEVLAPPAPKPPTPETENPLGDVPAAPPGSTEEAETTIVTPVEGGSVTSRDGAVTVDVKAGSVDAFVGLDVAPVADADVPPVPAALRLKTIGTVVDLTFTDPDGVPIDNFVAGKPVTVTIGYTDADALEASGARNLVIMKYDEAIGAWTALPTTVNLTAKTISAQVRSFSLFGIGAPVEVVVPAEPTATAVPPTAVPATATAVPPTAVPPTAVPPTAVPPTAVPPTAVPPTTVPATATPSPDVELPATGDVAPGMAAVIGLMMLGLALVGGGVAIVRRRQLREVSS